MKLHIKFLRISVRFLLFCNLKTLFECLKLLKYIIKYTQMTNMIIFKYYSKTLIIISTSVSSFAIIRVHSTVPVVFKLPTSGQ